MNRPPNSVDSRRKSIDANSKNSTAFGRRLIRGAEQILAYQRGDIKAEVYMLPNPKSITAVEGQRKRRNSSEAMASTPKS